MPGQLLIGDPRSRPADRLDIQGRPCTGRWRYTGTWLPNGNLAAETRLALVPLGQTVAADIGQSLRDAFGPARQLLSVELDVEPYDDEVTRVEIVANTDRAPSSDRDIALLDDAARAAGGYADSAEPGRVVYIHNASFA